MADVIVFPLVLRSPSQVEDLTEHATEIFAFPYSRRRHLVERHARLVRALPEAEADAYLTQVLERVCEELSEIGIDCQVNDMIFEFADAIGKELHGSHFRLRIDGGAE